MASTKTLLTTLSGATPVLIGSQLRQHQTRHPERILCMGEFLLVKVLRVVSTTTLWLQLSISNDDVLKQPEDYLAMSYLPQSGPPGPSGPSGGSGNYQSIYMGGPLSNPSSVPKVGLAVVVDPSTFLAGTVWRFKTVAAVVNPDTTGNVVLFNITDGVQVCSLLINSIALTLYTLLLSVPSNLPNSAKVYETRIIMNTLSATDEIVVSSIELVTSAA
jgi:hypothetical protein